MKKAILKSIIYLIGVIIITSSCDTQQKESNDTIPTQYEIVKINAENYINTKLDNPESYEFVELILIDSVLYIDNIEYRKQFFLESRDNTYPLIYKDAELKNKIEECNYMLSEIDSLELSLGERVNNVASFTYLYSFRNTNSFGAKVLNEYILQTDPAPDFRVINFTDDKNKILLNPNDFPGYKSIVAKVNDK
jgi:hypothetical protein